MPSGWGKRLATASSAECFRKKSIFSVRLCELAAWRHPKPIPEPRAFPVAVDEKDYHHLSRFEIGGGKRISQHLSGPEHFGHSSERRSNCPTSRPPITASCATDAEYVRATNALAAGIQS
jgi:hypothetical protein